MEKPIITAFENRIFTIRGKQVMLDSDLSMLFDVQVKRINEQVSRNLNRFPNEFAVQSTQEEWRHLKSQIANSIPGKGGKVKAPRAFTEHGIAMLATLLRSETAVLISIQIIQVFIKSRASQALLNSMDYRVMQLENSTALIKSEITTMWAALHKNELPEFGIFFENQIFDAYAFFSDILLRARKSIILIDNYIDHTVLLQLAKRRVDVSAIIYTERIPTALLLDLAKHNAQYPPIEIHRMKHVHDRFLLIDGKELYHIGASIKDLGKRWFAFSRMDSLVGEVLWRLETGE